MSGQATQLHSRLAAMLDRSAVDQLAIQSNVKDSKAMRRAAHLSLPPVLEKMEAFAATDQGPAVMSDILDQLATRQSNGSEFAGHLFGGDLEQVAHSLASKSEITMTQGHAALRATSVWALQAAASIAEGANGPGSIQQLFAADSAPISALEAGTARMTTETSRSATSSVASAPNAATQSSAQRSDATQKSGISGKLVGAALAGLLVIGGGLFVIGSGGSDDNIETVTADAPAAQDEAGLSDDLFGLADDPAEPADGPVALTDDELAADPEPSAAAPVSDDAATTETVSAAAEPEQTAPMSPTVTQLTVPMRDIRDQAPDANGVVDFTFDTLTGQICYEVGSLGVNPPYAAHIHAGDFGVKGGVVADLGLLDNGSTGCIDNLPADTVAILAKPSRHYAELHDAGGEWTVRGQLSETVNNPGVIPYSIPMRDILGTSPTASGVLNFDFNTLTGEVCYSVFSVGVNPPFDGHIHAGGFGVKGGVVLDLGGLDTGNEGCVANDLADTVAIMSNPSGHYAELHDISGDWTVRGQLSETIDNPGIVSLAVPMVDINNVEPTAAGTLAFDFNTVTGEICYDVTATNINAPFRSHIHAGDYGVKGGVVVDLGGLEDGSGGCVNNAVGDTLAILADPSGHYAELHDSGEEWTIRGQLSEASGVAVAPNTTNLLIDTDGGGASMRLQNGSIFLEGAVATQAIADEMVSSLSGVTTPIVNDLTIVAGSPVPSGRVIIGDTVFFDTGSSQIKSLPASTVTALVELVNSRPDWIMAIVGHTDDIGSDVYNLELSLRRAEALRSVLAAQGMNSDNIRVRGAGETAPIADNRSEDGRAQNRRIEFEFTPA